jgi:hypothetical protein
MRFIFRANPFNMKGVNICTQFAFIPSHGSEEDFQRFPIFQPIRSLGGHLE